MNSLRLEALPMELHWENFPEHWEIQQQRNLIITAGKKTDLFTSPEGNFVANNSPKALFETQGNFLLSAKVQVGFAATYDAGVLVVYENDQVWAKLCFEFSPQGQPMIVSVVNHGVSDDCNSVPIQGNQVYLRIAKRDQTFAFHYSIDGKFWHLIRFFTLGELHNLCVGFSAQSPTGEQCTAVFSEISYIPGLLKDIRNGE